MVCLHVAVLGADGRSFNKRQQISLNALGTCVSPVVVHVDNLCACIKVMCNLSVSADRSYVKCIDKLRARIKAMESVYENKTKTWVLRVLNDAKLGARRDHVPCGDVV